MNHFNLDFDGDDYGDDYGNDYGNDYARRLHMDMAINFCLRPQVFMPSYMMYPIVIFDKNIRTKFLHRFPMERYVGFMCAMKQMQESPEGLLNDVINYILHIIMDVDRIDFRLKITELVLQYFRIDALHIQYPDSDISRNQMHEGMILKLFHVAIMSHTKNGFKSESWGKAMTIRNKESYYGSGIIPFHKLDYKEELVKKKIMVCYVPCVCCGIQKSYLYNGVAICKRCYGDLRAYEFKRVKD